MRRSIMVGVAAVAVTIGSIGGNASAATVSAGLYSTDCAVASGSMPGGYGIANVCYDNGSTVGVTPPGAPVTEGPEAFGCIVVLTAQGFDYGCGNVPTNSISLDAALQSGSLNFSVPSQNVPSSILSATITMAGVGDPTYGLGGGPFVTGTAGQTMVGGGAYAYLARDISVNPGSVVGSTAVGGGVLASDQGGAMGHTFSAGVGIALP